MFSLASLENHLGALILYEEKEEAKSTQSIL